MLTRLLSFLLIFAGTLAAVSAALEPQPAALAAALILYGLLAVPMLRRPVEPAPVPVPARVTRRRA